MIICITGATGFIGKKLVIKHTARGDKVRILSRHSLSKVALPSSVQWFKGGLGSNYDLRAFVDGADVLYHCAGEIRDESRMEAVHVTGTHRLTEAAIGTVKHWVQLSSVGVYGPVASGIVTEDSPLNPVGQYEITKAQSDAIVIDAANRGAFGYSILRPSNVYGSDMANQSLFNLITMIDRGLFFYIGKQGASANYIHVDNVVEALFNCATLNSANGKIYNLSDQCTLEHFVNIISSLLGRSAPQLRIPVSVANFTARYFGRLPYFPLTQSRVRALANHSTYPITRIQNELGYRHIVSMEKGLFELVEAYKKNNRQSEFL